MSKRGAPPGPPPLPLPCPSRPVSFAVPRRRAIAPCLRPVPGFYSLLTTSLLALTGRLGTANTGAKFKMSRGLPVAAVLNCADNTGAFGRRSLRRSPSATLGPTDWVKVKTEAWVGSG